VGWLVVRQVQFYSWLGTPWRFFMLSGPAKRQETSALKTKVWIGNVALYDVPV